MKNLMGSKTGNASKKQDQAPKVKHRSPKSMKNVLAKAHIGGKSSTFHPFERLPIELQNIIWGFSIEPRPVFHREWNIRSKRNRKWGVLKKKLEEVDDTEIFYDDPPSDELPFWPREYSDDVVFDWITIPGCRHTPAILHVSKNAREIGLRHYKAQKSLQVILREHYLPQSRLQKRGRLQYNLRSSKAMYISQNHDLWCWESFFYQKKVHTPLSKSSKDLRNFMSGFLHQLMTPGIYNKFLSDKRLILEDFVGGKESSRKERMTLIIHMERNTLEESRMERRREFKELVNELLLSKKLVMKCSNAAGIDNSRSVDLKCNRFGFCKECLKATEDVVIGENMEANLHIWSMPRHLRKELQKPKSKRLFDKCKSSCDLTWGVRHHRIVNGLVVIGILVVLIPLSPWLF
ncbi:hypothetical protein OCU04_003301 [Sclerotinia nivalis]|uniref:2EXR domain-containing protein n=1 Tax=Sclerotinia nivalis TaxID=352851 RepID=A0A9X0DMK1_9HELO|nr:hypothetical protein OCU04_003301 [Sclerotinia nivalis]